MNLLINSVKLSLIEIIRTAGIGDRARIDYKANKKGELVMAIIIKPSRPGEWDKV